MRTTLRLALAGTMAAACFALAGCGNDAATQQTTTPFAVVAMTDGTTGAEPYLVKDGAVTLIKDINPGSGDSNPIGFTPLNGKICFFASDGTNYGLWVTDGTAAGTTQVKTFQANNVDKAANATIAKQISGGPAELTAFNGKLYFAANDGTNGTELWVTDGTATGTVMVKDINTTAGASSYPRSLAVMGSKLYFSATDGTNGYELWASDGTSAGTAMVKDINTSSAGASSYPGGFTAMNGKLYFQANDGVNGYELWVTNGTADGTVMLKDINTTAGASSYPLYFTPMGGKLYFRADDGVNGSELWVTDGTASGTTMVKDINTATAGAGSSPDSFTVFNGKLYFDATDGTHGYELWVSDGTEAGTVMLKDINTATAGASSYPDSFTIFNGKLYFNADDGVHGTELWVTDGTDAGTAMVADIYPGSSSSGAVAIQVFASMSNTSYLYGNFTTLLLSASDADHGLELWTTDGTAAGTKLLKDLNPGTGDGISLFGMKG
ncbi:ELWxxDGT repeat protein [Geobacter sp. FeAm09]|uniref:ELWxxDGT repeat protein n=1 Tax=Geobacter sp. FeAm09 TaxID=2597769 RepID=UPI00143CD47D|nr:ELWxxDGT repeat protein [Geobacter sp. FeAm09]